MKAIEMDLSKHVRNSPLGFYFLIFFLLSAVFLSACNGDKTLSTTEQAQQIRLAINNNDAEKLRTLSALPLMLRNQEWESAQDGYGFVLGVAKHTIISTNDLFNKTIPPFLKSLNIEGEQATTDITLTMLTSQLGKTINDWADLNLVIFKRGEGDVEHIVIMGLNKKTNKLNAIYIN
ncbi:MAG: hypothetical protein QM484_15545 [Woeseiaceae bacterium]